MLNLFNDKDLKMGKAIIFNFCEAFGDKVVRENLDNVKLTNEKVSHVSMAKLALDVMKDKMNGGIWSLCTAVLFCFIFRLTVLACGEEGGVVRSCARCFGLPIAFSLKQRC
ncbi:hypothetical protein Ddye_016119 [Dipteronia dyeriana]|uniref:Uncharacterized protein n=1 Tax=Dipteronia dyeriana TaxID=168575 RepID=A0AAD9X069_9ROSI|nr:hypothetical protein Ddye_016119 [Dipteronia dyeriana]